MAKILLTADQHIHPHSNKLKKLDACLEAFEWVYQVARERGVKTVLSLGDLFDDREKINILAYHKTFDIIAKAKEDGIETYLLMGNHDMYLRESYSVHSLRPLSPITTLIEEPKTLEIEGLKIDFLPYVSSPERKMKSLFPIGERSPICCGHVAISGAILNKLWGTKYKEKEEDDEDLEVVREETVPVGAFEGYQKVFLGHFHSRQCLRDNDQIQFIGSPLQLNYGEAMDKKGIEILDTETLETEFVENTFSQQYFILPYTEDLGKYNLTESNLRLVVPADFGNANIIEMRDSLQEKYGLSTIEIITSTDFVEAEASSVGEVLQKAFIFTEDKAKMVENYIHSSEVPEHLNKDILLQIGLEMMTPTGKEQE